MFASSFSFFMFLLFHTSLWDFVCGRGEFIAHRMMQYDKNRKPFGSRKSSVEHLVAPLIGTHDLGRNVAVIRMMDLTIELLQTLKKRRTQSLLIVLPPNLRDILTEEKIESFKSIESYLLTHEFDLSIWFAFENDDLKQVLQTIDAQVENIERDGNPNSFVNNVFGTEFQMSGKETSEIISSVKLSNFEAILKAPSKNGADGKNVKRKNARHIVVVANHDTFAAAPTLAFGANDNASGIVGVLQLASIFGRIYKNMKAKGTESKTDVPDFDMVFLLTAAGRFNYEGTRRWIDQHESRGIFLENVDFVLSLDSIARNGKLYLHVHRDVNGKGESSDDTEDTKLKTPESVLYTIFESLAVESKIDFEVVHKEITASTTINSWHHETFGRGGMFSVTLSGKREATPLHKGGTILDRIDTNEVDVNALRLHCEYAARVLLTYMYGYDAGNVLWNEFLNDGKNGTKKMMTFVSSSMNFLSTTPRFSHSDYSQKQKYLAALYTSLKRHVSDVTIRTYHPDSAFEKFYATQPVTISIIETKNFMFDFVAMVAILVYLAAFWLILKQPKSMDDVRAILTA